MAGDLPGSGSGKPWSVLRQSQVLVGGKVSALTFQTLQFAVLARVFAPSTFGAVMGAFSLLFIVGAVTELGLTNAAVLSLGNGTAETDVLGSTLAASLRMVLIGVAAAALLAWVLFRGEARVATAWLLPWMAMSNLDVGWIAIHQYRLRTGRIAFAESASRLVLLVLTLPLFALQDWSTTTLVAMLGAICLLSEICSFLIITRSVPFQATVDRHVRREIIRTAFPIGAANASGMMHSRSDQVVMATMGRQVGLASYAVAAKLNEAVIAVTNAAGMVTFPVITRAEAAERRRTTRRFVKMATLAGVLTGSAAFLLAPVATRLLGGTEFESAAVLVRIMVPALMVSIVNLPLAQYLFVERRATSLLRLSLVAVAVNVALTVVFVELYDAKGAALATTISEVGGLLGVAWLADRRTRDVVPWVFMLVLPTVTLIALGAALRLWHDGDYLLAAFATSSAAVVVALVAMRDNDASSLFARRIRSPGGEK